MKKTCVCCGYKTIDKNLLFATCEICYWKDDPIQSCEADSKEGENAPLSLREAQQNFKVFGACNIDSISYVRKPIESDEKDEAFVPYA